MATERFKEIQSAYAVLSDKHERSWYDQHRESILRGGRHGHLPDAHCPLRTAHCPPPTAHCSHPTAHIPQPRYGRGVGGGGGGDDSDEEEGGTDLWPLFSSSAFEGFGGGKGGLSNPHPSPSPHPHPNPNPNPHQARAASTPCTPRPSRRSTRS